MKTVLLYTKQFFTFSNIKKRIRVAHCYIKFTNHNAE